MGRCLLFWVKNHMNLSIITVTWNSIKNIDDQIQSVNAAVADLDYEHIIIDNGSTDGTVELLQSKYNENDLQLCIIENKENVGFSAANNEGVAMAKGDYLLFLNPDMRLEPASLRSLFELGEEQNKKNNTITKLLQLE